MTVRSTIAWLAFVGVAASGCSGAVSPAVSTSSTTAAIVAPAPSTTAVQGVDGRWETTLVTVDGVPWTVALADTPELRARGLMGISDLGGIDGMLFAYPEPVESRFWMKDTLLRLDIAFFDEAGRLIEVLSMEPCPADPCPSYGPDAPFRWALEAAAGSLGSLTDGARLVVSG